MIIKFFKYELNALLKAVTFYIDVFRNEERERINVEILRKIKTKLEKGLEEVSE